MLLMFATKHAWPEKYGDKVQMDDGAREALHGLAALGRSMAASIDAVKARELAAEVQPQALPSGPGKPM